MLRDFVFQRTSELPHTLVFNMQHTYIFYEGCKRSHLYFLLFQLKVAQLEWNYNWKTLNEKLSAANVPQEIETTEHSSRHQRLLRKRIFDVEKVTKHLHRANQELQSKLAKLETEVRVLRTRAQQETNPIVQDSIPGKNLQKYMELHELNEIDANQRGQTMENLNLEEKIQYLAKQQQINADALQNLTKQLSNSDKLHMSMLELLENVESIENKVDRNFPEFRKEISKLENQMSEATSEIALLKEEQTNTRESVKAIGVSVSNLQDKTDLHKDKIRDINATLENLKKSSNVQTSKLHNHILKVCISLLFSL